MFAHTVVGVGAPCSTLFAHTVVGRGFTPAVPNQFKFQSLPQRGRGTTKWGMRRSFFVQHKRRSPHPSLAKLVPPSPLGKAHNVRCEHIPSGQASSTPRVPPCSHAPRGRGRRPRRPVIPNQFQIQPFGGRPLVAPTVTVLFFYRRGAHCASVVTAIYFCFLLISTR